LESIIEPKETKSETKIIPDNNHINPVSTLTASKKTSYKSSKKSVPKILHHEYTDLSKVLKEKDMELRNIRHSPVDVKRLNKNNIANFNLDPKSPGLPLTHRTMKPSNTPSVIPPTGSMSPVQNQFGPPPIPPQIPLVASQSSTPIDVGPISPSPEEQNWSAGCISPVNNHVIPTSYVTQTTNPSSAPELEQQLYQNNPVYSQQHYQHQMSHGQIPTTDPYAGVPYGYNYGYYDQGFIPQQTEYHQQIAYHQPSPNQYLQTPGNHAQNSHMPNQNNEPYLLSDETGITQLEIEREAKLNIGTRPLKSKNKSKKQRLFSGQNDYFDRSDISTATTTSTNTSFSTNARRKAKKTVPQKINRHSYSTDVSVGGLVAGLIQNALRDGGTPVAALNELLHKRVPPCTAQYEENGFQQSPPFTINCVVDALGLKTEASGNSKKDAKHKAASTMMEMVLSAELVTDEHKHNLIQVDLTKVSNPVGLVQFYYHTSKLPAPEYRFTPALKPPFKCIASLSDGRTVEAIGHRRQDAKGEAAILLLKILKGDQIKHNYQFEALASKVLLNRQSSHHSSQSIVRSSEDENHKTHPVNKLFEFCKNNHIYAAQFELTQSEDDMGKIFTCSCTMPSYNLTTSESRRSPREAKRAVASRMYQLAINITKDVTLLVNPSSTLEDGFQPRIQPTSSNNIVT